MKIVTMMVITVASLSLVGCASSKGGKSLASLSVTEWKLDAGSYSSQSVSTREWQSLTPVERTAFSTLADQSRANRNWMPPGASHYFHFTGQFDGRPIHISCLATWLGDPQMADHAAFLVALERLNSNALAGR